MRAMILAALLLPAACAADDPQSYRLFKLEGQPTPMQATLTMAADGSIFGEGPCNSYRASNRATFPDLRFDGIAATRRACLTEGGEGAFFRVLEQVNRADYSKGGLVLSGPGGTLDFRLDR